MLAANHSTYLWHDVKIPQDLMPGEGVGTQCYGSGESRGKLMCPGAFEPFLVCGFLFLFGCVFV